ncbi:hypothetical protein BC832DRAFT_596094 [Gaertneriomyces semiglobifer]|nr:hypothetical protein BC832DRAFT_596094 [Gaertneriomyces semiglobifer]
MMMMDAERLASSEHKRSSVMVSELEDMLKCFICYERLNDPRMCPHCSKIGCEGCLQKWLEDRQSCPHCRSSLSTSALIKCRFLEELRDRINKVESYVRTDEVDTCMRHKAALYYYCIDCKEPLCADCAVLESKHKRHKLNHIHRLYESHRDLLLRKTKIFREHIGRYDAVLGDVDEQMQCLRKSRDGMQEHYDTILRKARDRLHNRFVQRMGTLKVYKARLVKDSQRLRDTVASVDGCLSSGSKSELVCKFPQLVNLALQHPSVLRMPRKPDASPEFENDLIPPYIGTRFCFPSVFSQECDVPCYSDNYTVAGTTWRLRLETYPSADGTRSIGVSVELVHGYPERSTYQCRMCIMHTFDPDRTTVLNFDASFEPGSSSELALHDFDGMHLNDFIEPSDESLEIHFAVRPMTYGQKCRDLMNYVKQLEKRLGGSKRKFRRRNPLSRHPREHNVLARTNEHAVSNTMQPGEPLSLSDSSCSDEDALPTRHTQPASPHPQPSTTPKVTSEHRRSRHRRAARMRYTSDSCPRWGLHDDTAEGTEKNSLDEGTLTLSSNAENVDTNVEGELREFTAFVDGVGREVKDFEALLRNGAADSTIGNGNGLASNDRRATVHDASQDVKARSQHAASTSSFIHLPPQSTCSLRRPELDSDNNGSFHYRGPQRPIEPGEIWASKEGPPDDDTGSGSDGCFEDILKYIAQREVAYEDDVSDIDELRIALAEAALDSHL